ncbi:MULTISPECIES: BMC domain-containing protein [Brasilonema]|jgi:microcompartment protein CcmL/EutN|uniref:Carboxysome shell protein CcmK n=3 Tax=Brasilonema TaxID=383614 RepID=A0A856MJ16_9CYAN|nr:MULTISPECIES: BMC domain-containing protein [Brasilonema]MBP5977028.1 BMC domain-containing protein [Brasilonema sp. CT11]MBW4630021.1 BMC domain-containing protein [Brasilonema octagenarum HA4186-MV1]QDL17025.1 carbon dioxide-concentrating protein CcmK [Brasilonema octagenarum UFV-E1]NMF64358.1 carbon dioxide-concentrating protein CcmK [Brasilonema octagenarum UFV-OR1]NMG18407.1 carbon dioxide-concentrating protein CcmK [Brasilonema bromeliae SPC951]
MPMAVGVIETQGFPAVLAAADAMVKAAAVTIVYYGLAESARMLVAVRGHTAEVERAVEAGIEAGNNQSNGGTVITHYIVPNPPENVESILPIHFTQKSEPFRIM